MTLEENQILENGEPITDFPFFLKKLSANEEITLILKTHDALYHFCPIRKAVPFLKSAEYSSDYWVGERILSKGQTFIGGILPTPFMREVTHFISEYSFALKGTYLWADLVTQSYGPLPSGWILIWHEQHLLICHDGILQFSRSCYLPLVHELPAILRYLKRFGYEEEMPITLLKVSTFEGDLPSFIHQETRDLQEFSPQIFTRGLTFQIPELSKLNRLFTWPRKIREVAYALTLIHTVGIAYLSWQIKGVYEQKIALTHEIALVPLKNPLDESKMDAFAAYRRLSKDRPNPLSLIRLLIPLMKDQAVATHLHWTPNFLSLHLELSPTGESEQLFLTLRSQFLEHRVTWKAEENEPLKGILTIEKRIQKGQES